MSSKNKAESDKRIEYLAKGRPAEYDKARRKLAAEKKWMYEQRLKFLSPTRSMREDAARSYLVGRDWGTYWDSKRKEWVTKAGTPAPNKEGKFVVGTGTPDQNKVSTQARNAMIKREAIKRRKNK